VKHQHVPYKYRALGTEEKRRRRKQKKAEEKKADESREQGKKSIGTTERKTEKNITHKTEVGVTARWPSFFARSSP
jgi:hypothetical protein